MKHSPALYLALPLLCACLSTFKIFELSADFSHGVLFLAGLALTICAVEVARIALFKKVAAYRPRLYTDFMARPESRLLIAVFGSVIIIFCVLDLAVHGVVIAMNNFEAYAIFTPVERHIRHISLMCWTLAPLAFLLGPKRKLSWCFLLTALVFPVLVLDRNRLLATYAAMATTLFLYPELIFNPYKRTLAIAGILLVGATQFAYLGSYRSGDEALRYTYSTPLDEQESNRYGAENAEKLRRARAECKLPQMLPVTHMLTESNAKLQWIYLYVAAPIYNFSTIYKCRWKDSDHLKAQLIPRWGRDKTLLPAPLVSPYLNVGTEFMPFLMAGGALAVAAAMLCCYLLFLWSANALANFNSIFIYLIFLRVTYASFTISFAPQFFTWTTIGFFILCATLGKLERSKLAVDTTRLVQRFTRQKP